MPQNFPRASKQRDQDAGRQAEEHGHRGDADGKPDRIPFVGSEVQQPLHARVLFLVRRHRRQNREALRLEKLLRFSRLQAFQECRRFGVLEPAVCATG